MQQNDRQDNEEQLKIHDVRGECFAPHLALMLKSEWHKFTAGFSFNISRHCSANSTFDPGFRLRRNWRPANPVLLFGPKTSHFRVAIEMHWILYRNYKYYEMDFYITINSCVGCIFCNPSYHMD